VAKMLKADNMSKCIGCFTCMFICAGINRRDHSIDKSCIRIRTYGGMAGRYISVVCNACQSPACAEVCPTGALSLRKGGGVDLTDTKCIGCRRCVSACMLRAVGYDYELHQPIICHHCGMCAHYCPHGCLTMLDVPD